MGKRVAYGTTVILQLAALVGTYLLYHFEQRRLGMVRWLNYHNQKWEAALPLEAITWVAVVLVIVATLVLLVIALKKRTGLSKLAWAALALCIVLAVCYTMFVALGVQAGIRAFWLMDACATVAMILQIVKTIICIRGKGVAE